MESQRHRPGALLDVTIRSLQESELDIADRIFRVAFGIFIGLPNPQTFAGDSDALRTRWKADPTRVFAAAVDGELVGTNVASNWGSMGFFGPLTIRPDLWDQGIAQSLMQPVMEKFSEWGTQSCQGTHFTYVISGHFRTVMDDGTVDDLGPGDIAITPPGHNAMVVGDEPCVLFDFQGASRNV